MQDFDGFCPPDLRRSGSGKRDDCRSVNSGKKRGRNDEEHGQQEKAADQGKDDEEEGWGGDIHTHAQKEEQKEKQKDKDKEEELSAEDRVQAELLTCLALLVKIRDKNGPRIEEIDTADIDVDTDTAEVADSNRTLILNRLGATVERGAATAATAAAAAAGAGRPSVLPAWMTAGVGVGGVQVQPVRPVSGPAKVSTETGTVSNGQTQEAETGTVSNGQTQEGQQGQLEGEGQGEEGKEVGGTSGRRKRSKMEKAADAALEAAAEAHDNGQVRMAWV